MWLKNGFFILKKKKKKKKKGYNIQMIKRLKD